MNLFIKVCQCKDQNDDSTNAKYFDLLDSILADCEAELDTPLETLHLHDTAVSVLYQLVLICPLASLTSIIPKLVPVLVDVIRLNEASEEEAKFIKSMKTNASRCLSSIYQTTNVVTLSTLLVPLFRKLDSYGWHPLSFSHDVMHTLTGNKNKDAIVKPIYLHIITHIGDLIPGLFSSEDFSGNDSESGMNFESEGGLQRKSDDSAIHEVEMADFRMKPCLFAVIRCILYCVESQLQEARSISLNHEQKVTDDLLILLQYLLHYSELHQL